MYLSKNYIDKRKEQIERDAVFALSLAGILRRISDELAYGFNFIPEGNVVIVEKSGTLFADIFCSAAGFHFQPHEGEVDINLKYRPSGENFVMYQMLNDKFIVRYIFNKFFLMAIERKLEETKESWQNQSYPTYH